MKPYFIFVLLLLVSCATQIIPMKETPLKLTDVKKEQTMYGESLTLIWQSLDGHISIITNAPAQDSNQYVARAVYARCFLRQ